MKMELKKDNFSNMTMEDLIKKKKSTSFATGLLAGVLIVAFVNALFQAINKGFTPLLVIPFAFLPIFIMSYGQIKSINKELKSRKSN